MSALAVVIGLAIWIPFSGFLLRAAVATHNRLPKISKTFALVDEPSYRRAMGIVICIPIVVFVVYFAVRGLFDSIFAGPPRVVPPSEPNYGLWAILVCAGLLATVVLLTKALAARFRDSLSITLIFVAFLGIVLAISNPLRVFLAGDG